MMRLWRWQMTWGRPSALDNVLDLWLGDGEMATLLEILHDYRDGGVIIVEGIHESVLVDIGSIESHGKESK